MGCCHAAKRCLEKQTKVNSDVADNGSIAIRAQAADARVLEQRDKAIEIGVYNSETEDMDLHRQR